MMGTWVFLSAIFAISLFANSANGQSPAGQVCVAAMEGAGGGVSPTSSRDALIKFLHKKNAQLDLMPLDQSAPDQAIAAAKQKNCKYVLTTNLSELHSDSGYIGGLSQVNLQTFYVTVTYKLTEVEGEKEVSSGSQKASDRGGPQPATTAATHKIADKVAEALKK